jgi:drug/metabolite transporter (DMT)-like permease
LGLVLGIAGILIIFKAGMSTHNNQTFLGVSLAMISVLSASAGAVHLSHKKMDIAVLFVVGLQNLASGIILWLVSILFHFQTNPFESREALWALMYLVFVGTIIGYSSFVFAVNHLDASTVSVQTYISPVITILLSYFILHESMNLNFLIGSTIILLGVVVLVRNRKASLTISK